MNGWFLIAKSIFRFYDYYYNLLVDLCQVYKRILLDFWQFEQREEIEFMSFAENFKRICDERGTSPTRVCLDLGLSSSKVNLWNKGTIPRGDVMVKLAQKLECSVLDFFDEEYEAYNRGEYELDDDEKDIIRLFRTLSRKEKHEFMSKAYTYESTMMRNE